MCPLSALSGLESPLSGSGSQGAIASPSSVSRKSSSPQNLLTRGRGWRSPSLFFSIFSGSPIERLWPRTCISGIGREAGSLERQFQLRGIPALLAIRLIGSVTVLSRSAGRIQAVNPRHDVLPNRNRNAGLYLSTRASGQSGTPATIVAVTDFADEERLLFHVIQQAKRRAAKVLLVHVLDSRKSSPGAGGCAQAAPSPSCTEFARTSLHRMARQLRWVGIACEPFLLRGAPAREILLLARASCADSILMTAPREELAQPSDPAQHAASAIRETALLSPVNTATSATVQRVVTQALCPVIVLGALGV